MEPTKHSACIEQIVKLIVVEGHIPNSFGVCVQPNPLEETTTTTTYANACIQLKPR